jgi:hypothetical protein
MTNMKANKYFLIGALGLGLAGVSTAQTVYMTGSTAFRGNTFTALSTSGVVFNPAPTVTTWGNATASKGNFMTFVGTAVGGGALTVQCSWSGSEAGVADVALGTAEPFSADTADGTVHSGNPTTTANHVVDIAMADNDTPFSKTYGNNPTPPTAIVNKAEVGVVTFKWVRNPGLWTGANVADYQIRQALTPPFGAFQAVFDGNPASLHSVYVSGRDNGSGTRVNTFGISGYGIFTPPGQIELSGGVMQSVGGKFIGDFGFTSGGTLAGTLGTSTVGSTDSVNGGTGFSVIAYLGFNDAATAVTAGATELTYNGVLFSLGAITEGNYDFWGNEYIMQNNAAVAPATTVYANLAALTGINSTIPLGAANTAPNGIRLSDMHTTRSGPLGDPQHK